MFRHVAFISLIGSLIAACSSQPRDIAAADLAARKDAYFSEYAGDLSYFSQKSERRIKGEASAGSAISPVYDVLVLSGGGSWGAFGAGFLDGWGAVTDPDYARPVFDSVSGVSTGAILAPFAFVGTEDAYAKIVDLYRNPSDGLISSRFLSSLLGSGPSLFRADGLHTQIYETFDETLIEAIAAGAQEDRLLLVGATNLDYATMRVWDLGRLASENAYDIARQKIHSRIVASSAIPGVFPPQLIDGLLYVDGGAAMQVVGGIEDRAWLYEESGRSFTETAQNRPIKIRIWVIINNKLITESSVTKLDWSDIAVRSLETLTRVSTLQTLLNTETFAEMINQRPGFEAEMHYVAIPQVYQIPDTEDMFDQQVMRRLVELGRSMGSDPSSWMTRTPRPGSPELDLRTSSGKTFDVDKAGLAENRAVKKMSAEKH